MQQQQRPTLTVPVYANMSVDGGPYVAFSGGGIDGRSDPENGYVYGSDDNGNEYPIAVEELEDVIADEMRSHEPISLSTGDDTRDEREALVGEIEVPLVRGFFVEIHDLPGQGQDLVANLDNLEGDEPRRRHFERQLERRGGGIESV